MEFIQKLPHANASQLGEPQLTQPFIPTGCGIGGSSAVGLIAEARVLIPVLTPGCGAVLDKLCQLSAPQSLYEENTEDLVHLLWKAPGDLWMQCGLRGYAVLVCRSGVRISCASPLLSSVLRMAVVKCTTELVNLPLTLLILILKVLLT